MSDDTPTHRTTAAAVPKPNLSEEGKEEDQGGGALKAGDLVAGRYRVEGFIGKGGMGGVYRARHETMSHQVAIKVLHAELAGEEEFSQRFLREAQTASVIVHPNLCAATDFGQLPDGAAFIVMEYLDGETLEKLLDRQGRLEVSQTLSIARQIASVLKEAHEAGVVHRDLKPENVMLVTRAGRGGVVKVMDFGIASVREGERLAPSTRITRVGVAYGTPAYMSPEQVAGETDFDGRVDLYALGIMMFEMLTGEPPFVAPNAAALMAKHLTEQPPSLRAKAPQAKIPAALDGLVLSLMSKEPSGRPESAAALLHAFDELEGASASSSSPASSSTALLPAAVAPHRRLVLYIALPLAALLLLALGGALALMLGAADELFSGLKGAPSELLGQDAAGRAVTGSQQEEAIKVAKEQEKVQLSLEQSRQSFLDEQGGMDDLLVKMAAGQHDEALEALEARREELGESAHYAYYAGLAYEGADRDEEATKAYLEAVERDERYARDEHLAEHFERQATEGRPGEISDEAFKAHPALAEAIVTGVARRAREHELSSTRRKRAIRWLKRRGEFERLSEAERGLIALENASGCAARREAVEALAAQIEEPGVREALRRWQRKPRSGCAGGTIKSKFLKDRDCYACMRPALNRALSAAK